MHWSQPNSPLQSVKTTAVAFVATAATLGLAAFLSHYAPIRDWLCWRYVAYWLATIVWSMGCIVTGHALSVRWLRVTLPAREQLLVSAAVGVYVFFIGIFLAGLAGALHRVLFFVLPAAMIAAGGHDYARYVIPLLRHMARARRKARAPSHLTVVVTVLGFVALSLIYFAVITPSNVGFDARWYHLPLAEHYAAQGAIRRFPEGWFLGAYPQLASLLYTWAFLAPGNLFDHVELCCHIELALFLGVLVGIPAIVRALVPQIRASWSWAFLFAFPAVYFYRPAGEAEYVAAFWAAPLLLVTRRAFRTFTPRYASLAALLAACVFLTKYSAVTLILPPLLFLSVRALRGFARPETLPGDRRTTLFTVLVAAIVGNCASAPHWLKNWLFYGDPLYPLLYRHVRLHPWTPDATMYQRYFWETTELWRPPPGWGGLRDSLEVMFTFAFAPHEFANYTQGGPFFGFLFTLSLGLLPFVRGAVRALVLHVACLFGVFVWYRIHHQDRYLIALLPWMTAATVAAFLLAWQQHRRARGPLVGLVVLQAVWGLGVYFRHAPIAAAASLVAASATKDAKAQVASPSPVFAEIGSALPQSAVVLVHEEHAKLGFGRATVSDETAWQGGLSYRLLGSDAAVFETLRKAGVTHLVWSTGRSKAFDSLAGDLAFFSFAMRHAQPVATVGGYSVAAMPAASPPQVANDRIVAVLGCGAPYAPGVYELRDLAAPGLGTAPFAAPAPRAPTPPKATIDDVIPMAKDADFLVIDPRCAAKKTASLTDGFRLGATRSEVQLWVRK